MVGFCEHNNKSVGSTEFRELLDWLRINGFSRTLLHVVSYVYNGHQALNINPTTHAY